MLQQSEIVIGDRRYPVNAGELRAIHAVGRLVLACGRGGKALDRVQLPTRGEVLQFWTFGARVSRTAGDMASASWFETRLQAATAKHAPPPDPARAPAVPNLLAPAESTPKPPREPLVNARELAHILGVPLGLVHRKSQHANWKPTVLRSYEMILTVHLVPAFHGRNLRSITAEDVQRYKSDRLSKDGLAPKTVNNHLGVLGSLFEDAVKWKYAAHNPTRQVKPCRVDRVDEDFAFWRAAESDLFLASIQEVRPRWLPFFLTALRTGLRLGELAALRWTDVDFVARKVHVRRSYSQGHETIPKSGKGRSLPMSPQLFTALAGHKLANAGAERVFLSDEGEVLDSNRVKHSFWAGIKASGVPRIRIHDLRHSFASQLVIAGESLFKVQTLMGHSDPKMTQRYAHLRAEDLGESVGVLDNAENSAARLRHAGPGKGV